MSTAYHSPDWTKLSHPGSAEQGYADAEAERQQEEDREDGGGRGIVLALMISMPVYAAALLLAVCLGWV